MHRDIGAELEPKTAEQAALDLWRQEFNNERPHEGLGMKCLGEIYTRAARADAGSPRDLVYTGLHGRKINKWPRQMGRRGNFYHYQLARLVSGIETGWRRENGGLVWAPAVGLD